MQNATRLIATAIAAVLWAVALVLLLRQWLNGEEISFVLPCVFGGFGAGLLGLVMFYPFASLEQGSCGPDSSNDDSGSSEGELREIDS